MLENFELDLFAIRNLIANDEKIRKLLYNDSNNALNLDAPDISKIMNYITLFPLIEFEDRNDYTKNSMISIFYSTINAEEDMNSVLRINIVVNKDKWVLLNNKIRPIQIADSIIRLLNNKKLNSSNTITFDNMSDLIIDKKIIGYSLVFAIIDGKGIKDNY